MLDLLLVIVFLILETVYELASAAILDFLLRTIVMRLDRPPFQNPVVAAVGYTVLGVAAGGLSLIPFPDRFVHTSRIHGISLLVGPLITGSLMSLTGFLLRQRGKTVVQIESFSYGFAFAFGMALVRFLFAA